MSQRPYNSQGYGRMPMNGPSQGYGGMSMNGSYNTQGYGRMPMGMGGMPMNPYGQPSMNYPPYYMPAPPPPTQPQPPPPPSHNSQYSQQYSQQYQQQQQNSSQRPQYTQQKLRANDDDAMEIEEGDSGTNHIQSVSSRLNRTLTQESQVKDEKVRIHIEDKRKLQEKKHEWFLGKLKYRNNLPDIPFDVKFLKFPFDPLRFIRYSTTSMEKNQKFELKPEPNLGIHLDLVDIQSFNSIGVPLPAEDEILMQEFTGSKQGTVDRSARIIAPFLRRTEYVSAASHHVNLKDLEIRPAARKEIFLTAKEQTDIILKSFEDVKVIPKHPRNPSLTPVDIFPVFPDFDLWENTYTQCCFDMDPFVDLHQESEELTKEELKKSQLEFSLLKPMINPSDQNDNFLLYCQPTEETITKRKRKRQEKFREDDDEFEDEEVYKCTREYRCTIKTDEETKRSFVFFFKDNEVVFNECNSKVILQVKGKRQKDQDYVRPSGVVVKRTKITSEEKKHRKEKLSRLVEEEIED